MIKIKFMEKEYVYRFMSVSKAYLEGQPMPICMKNLTDEDMLQIAKRLYDIFYNEYGYSDLEIREFYQGDLDDEMMNEMDDIYLEHFERIALEYGAFYY